MIDYKKPSKIIAVLFVLISVLIGIYNIFSSDFYYTSIAFASILFLVVPLIFYKIFDISPLYDLEIIYYSFCFLGYTLGIVCALYRITTYYDKVVHTLSGIFFSFVGIMIFSFLEKKKAEKNKYFLVSIFSFSFSITIAALWEICEYIISVIFKTDPQNFLTTGLNDTMIDIIVCLIGTLFFQISIYLFYKRDIKTPLMRIYNNFFTDRL